MEISTDEAEVIPLNAPQKQPTGDLMLVPASIFKCQHWKSSFEIDLTAGKCKCLECSQEVSPMFVLEALMHKESRWNRNRESYQEEMKRLKERASTKCNHCGKMTRISGR